jgi:hypothetical protein
MEVGEDANKTGMKTLGNYKEVEIGENQVACLGIAAQRSGFVLE